MDVVIPTKGRANVMTTPYAKAFEDADKYILVHTTDERDRYLFHHPRLHKTQVCVTYTKPDEYGLTRQREWWIEHGAGDVSWFCFADDNITEVTGVPRTTRLSPKLPVQTNISTLPNWKELFAHVIDAGEFDHIFAQDTHQARKRGFHMVAFATTGNHYFRGTRWREVGYGIGKMMFWHADARFEWDHTITMEDFRNTAEHTYLYGGLLIDNYVYPECIHYQPGGMGTYAERVPFRQRDVRKLMTLYPEFFRIKNRKHFVENTDLAVRYTSRSQVEAWRTRMSAVR